MSLDLPKRRKQYLIDQRTLYYSVFTQRLCLYTMMVAVNFIVVCIGHTAHKATFSATQPSKGKALDLNLQPSTNNYTKSTQALIPESHAEKFYNDEQIHKTSKEGVTIHMAPHQKIQPFENSGNARSPLYILQNPSRPHDSLNPKQLIEQPPSIGLKKII